MIKFSHTPRIDFQRVASILSEIETDPMGGWFQPQISPEELNNIKTVAKKVQKDSKYLVCIGIGGSYIGHRALIEALEPTSPTKILYAGNSLSRRELDRVLKTIENTDFSINMISKSGSTFEPSIAFTVLKEKLIKKYGKEKASQRIYATTDAEKGALHDEAVKNGYQSFSIPDNVGGRFSVLTPVGLFPLAVAGVDIDQLLAGAIEGKKYLTTEDSPAIKYAFMRYALLKRDFDTEIFATSEPSTAYFNEWLKQLFGESEGKNHQSIFPTSVIYSTDLHSIGQFIQDGRRDLFETIVNFPTDELNNKVLRAAKSAHESGCIPVLEIKISSYDAKAFGELIYFFELSCAVSAKLQGLNPFDQPAVDVYKAELKKLLA